MAAGSLAGFNFGNFKGHNFCIIEGYNPAQRTDELEVQVAPAHIVREVQTADEFRQNGLQQFSRFLALFMYHGIDITVFFHEVFRVNALTTGKALSSLGRVAVSIKSDGCGRAAVFTFHIFLLFREVFDQESRAARRTDGADFPAGNAAVSKSLSGIFLQLGKDARHDMCRYFFRADF